MSKWEINVWAGGYDIMPTGVFKPLATVHGCDKAAETNALLVRTAVNACKAINPDNPQAAAEAIEYALAVIGRIEVTI